MWNWYVEGDYNSRTLAKGTATTREEAIDAVVAVFRENRKAKRGGVMDRIGDGSLHFDTADVAEWEAIARCVGRFVKGEK